MAKIKFQKYAILVDGKKIPVRYAKGSYTKESGIPEGTITIYAKEYSLHLPSELNPENNTEIQTDYFEKDRARIEPDNPYYEEVKKLAN